MTKLLSFLQRRKQPQPACAATDVSAVYQVAFFLAGPQSANSRTWWDKVLQQPTRPHLAGHRRLVQQLLLSCDQQQSASAEHGNETIYALAQLCWDKRVILVLADITNHPITLCADVLDSTFEETQNRLYVARQALHEVMKNNTSPPDRHRLSSASEATYLGNFPAQLSVNSAAPSDVAQGGCTGKPQGGAYDV